MTNPTTLLVPGAWLPPTIYTPLTPFLSAAGYPVLTLPLPSCDASPPHADFSGDVRGIRACLHTLIDEEEKDVVLVLHSYTGMPGTEAPVGLGKKERERAGKKGGVLRLVYVNALAPCEGFSLTAGGQEYPSWMRLDADKGVFTVSPSDAQRLFFNDLSEEEGDAWADTLRPQSAGVYTSTQTYAAWRHIPSTYVTGTRDQTHFNRETVNFFISTARLIEPTAFDVVEEVDAGHCLMISQAEWLAGVLRRAAGESL
ncbi:alpha/beta-hydrolase [Bimuria novae-zelandiae CBS 107.79]|uniref:Alpha/beta-hydrolase n=1 Tax=Bimuria novae-zelandiae CBS 107.79 TaxID=1447943 RepID=A0A6A5V436_9PLEO|nr:alpha/beta-hydrolase [Bimuria novae-zelandiae CBS 107.79]